MRNNYRDIDELVCRIRGCQCDGGCSDCLTDKEKLLAMLKPLIYSNVKQCYCDNLQDVDDAAQNFKIKILECLSWFNPDRGVPFLVFVRSSLLKTQFGFRHQMKKHENEEINHRIMYDPTDDELQKLENRDTIVRVIRTMPSERQRRVIFEKYVQHRIDKHVGKIMNLSYSEISQLHTRGIETLTRKHKAGLI